ncbi:hypothetical protein [Flavobacterium piscis]|uniref:Lipid/polyisoprenoid-binding YceI-like domain-containing protein n=1 Tax=Flavobacterium piscis TaxID=1114874 RepID=A0ABU1YCF5_9FLAO|nr:hypothetical protein [Flavobacterium piscis]MDR7211928.1 hypothetical protein [Flavobacterium piscis]
MKKQLFISLTALCFSILSSCNSKSTTPEDTGVITTETNEIPDEIVSNSKLKVSFNFNGRTFKNDLNQPKELKGMRTDGTNWFIALSGVETDKEISLQFAINNFNLEKGVTKIKVCTLNLMGFDETEVSDAILFSKETIFLEITNIEKVKSQSSMGTSMEEYSISGKFHGEFKNITNTKTYKVENGTFENYTLVDFKKS